MANWKTLKIDMVIESAENEFDEDTTEIHPARVDVSEVIMYYASQRYPGLISLVFGNGDMTLCGNTLEEIRLMVEGGKG